MSTVGFGAAFLAGLLSFLSPCVLPLVPVYLAYLAGASYTELVSSTPRGRILFHAMGFILGFSAVFIALGATASFFGGLILSHRLWIERVGGAVILVLGLWMAGVLPIGFLSRELRWLPREKPLGATAWLGSVVIGAAFAAGWTPCVGPILAAILLYASREGSVGFGVALLSFYSLGLAVPLLLCALAVEPALRFLKRLGPSLPMLERATGACLVAMGVLLASGFFGRMINWTLGQFPGWVRWMAERGFG